MHLPRHEAQKEKNWAQGQWPVRGYTHSRIMSTGTYMPVAATVRHHTGDYRRKGAGTGYICLSGTVPAAYRYWSGARCWVDPSHHIMVLAVFHKTIFKRQEPAVGKLETQCSNRAHNFAPSFPLPIWCALFQLYALTFLQLDVSGTGLLTIYRAKMCSFLDRSQRVDFS